MFRRSHNSDYFYRQFNQTSIHMRFVEAGFLFVALAVASAPVQSQTHSGSENRVTGILIVAHGGDSLWNDRVLRLAAQVKSRGPVEVSFLMGPAAKDRRFQDQVTKLVQRHSTEIVVVPLLVSSHSGHYEQIRYLAGDSVRLDSTMLHHLHMAGLQPAKTAAPIVVTRAMDDAPEIATLVTERARSLAGDAGSTALFILAHGPNSAEDYAAWMRNLRIIADSVNTLVKFRDIRVDVLRDDAPAPVRAEAVTRVRELIALQHTVTGKPVIVVPLFVSQGSITRQSIPRDLAGLPIVYTGEPLLPSEQIARWVERRVREASGQRTSDVPRFD